MKTTTKYFFFLSLLAVSCTNGLSDAYYSSNDNLKPGTELTDQYTFEMNETPDYRDEMVSFVTNIGDYARQQNPSFVVIPQNGEELIYNDSGTLNQKYLNGIDGLAREDLFFGYEQDNKATPKNERLYMQSFLDEAKKAGKPILTIDYAWSPKKIDRSFERNHDHGYIPFVAPHRSLDIVPGYDSSLYNENANDIQSLSEAKNFLYLINPQNYGTKEALLQDLEQTNHDLIVIDLFLYDDISFTAAEVARLKTKANGGKRLVLAYMSIGEAEDYRYYWDSSWNTTAPNWMEPENPNWPGNFKVKYWSQQWQDLIWGTSESYLDRILAAGFDGTYLDLIDAYYYFETT
ncbi:endo alpha-1,4 polygalactosaminidase [Fodinibius salsisoli]|uniref:Endo alpha-1,4 polygalactosaminidase n=1 Tax=Fodinibius salsisoli TaxID=2820877 RepID=A0ABT3PS35_9BACT|nr:endo alpha-1,4 polygalactosaminidase [Fodinibius salsisoli]MCW9708679.1 endo alpha-1,4 polygalactosaminidase [Fodinibius salsisoli]